LTKETETYERYVELERGFLNLM